MSTSQSINALVSAVATTLGQLNAPVARRFAGHLASLAGSPAKSAPARVPACRHLEQTDYVSDAVPSAQSLRAAAQAADPHLGWKMHAFPEVAGPYNENHSFVEIVGPSGHIEATDVRYGLFVLGPQVHYPRHVHGAEEIYLILSGTADWQQDDDPFRPVPPGEVVHNLSMQPHAIQVHGEPVVMFWAWAGDISFARYAFV